jgi:ribose transport system substrate-binding protein
MHLDPMRFLRAGIAGVVGAVLGCLAVILPATRKEPSPPVIAFIPRTTGTNLTEDMHRGALAAAQSAGYRIYWNAPTREDDVERQIRIAEGAVHRGVKALILGPASPRGVTTLLDQLQSRKIPVVIVQTKSPIPTGLNLTSITPNQSLYGRIAADRVSHITGGTGEVAVIGLDRGTPETLERADSFIHAIASYPGIQVVAQSPGSVQTLEADQSTRELIRAYPRLRVIFAVSADATQGAMLALQNMNPKRAIALIGCDRDLFLVDSLIHGRMDSLIATDPYKIGYLAVRSALPGAEHHPLPPPQQVPPALITRESLVMIDNH